MHACIENPILFRVSLFIVLHMKDNFDFAYLIRMPRALCNGLTVSQDVFGCCMPSELPLSLLDCLVLMVKETSLVSGN